MTWLVWRQHRYELLGLVLGGVLIALALVWGVAVATTVREELEVDRCQPTLATNVNCTLLAVQAGERVQPFRWLLVALFFLPAIVGSFIGGPLFSREFERGTQRFAWSQAVSRLRWSAGKLGALMAAGAIGGLAVALAGSPGRAINGGGPNAFTNFDIEGPAFVSYVLFAIAVCAFVGTISRRIITGMFVGLLVFGGARLAVMYEARPNYQPAITVSYGASDAHLWGQFKVPDGAWHLGTQYINANGDAVPSGLVTEPLSLVCPTAQHLPGLWHLRPDDVPRRERCLPAPSLPPGGPVRPVPVDRGHDLPRALRRVRRGDAARVTEARRVREVRS
jgi:hypothetical protein